MLRVVVDSDGVQRLAMPRGIPLPAIVKTAIVQDTEASKRGICVFWADIVVGGQDFAGVDLNARVISYGVETVTLDLIMKTGDENVVTIHGIASLDPTVNADD